MSTKQNEKKLYVKSGQGEIVCAEHAGRYLTAELERRPELKRAITPLGVWTLSRDPEDMCEQCPGGVIYEAKQKQNKKQDEQKEKDMSTIAVPTKKAAPKKAAPKKETQKKAAPKTQAAKKQTASVSVKIDAKKDAPKKSGGAKKQKTMFLVFRDITEAATSRQRSAKSFDPIQYVGVIEARDLREARKLIDANEDYATGDYDAVRSYDDSLLTQKAMRALDGAKVEKVASKKKDTFSVTVSNTGGLSDSEVRELALIAWTIDAPKHSKSLVGNERMLDRVFKFEKTRELKNDRAVVTFSQS